LKKIQLLIVLSFLYISDVSAQGIHYGGMQQFQFNFGQNGSGSGLSIINGVRFSRFFVGLGADAQFGRRETYYQTSGWGYYGYDIGSTATLFVDGRYYINKNKTFFAKVNGGANLLYGSQQSNDYYALNRRAGLYSACGLGFKIRLAKEVFYSFDVSYSTRQTRYDIGYLNNGNNRWYTDKYDIQRYFITVNMGIELF